MRNNSRLDKNQLGMTKTQVGIGVAGVIALGVLLFFVLGRPKDVVTPTPDTTGSTTETTPTPKPKPLQEMPKPLDSEAYFKFQLDNAIFNLILPKGSVDREISPEAQVPEFFFSVDAGDFLIISGQINPRPPPLDDRCSAFTKERLSGFDFTGSGFYRLNHESGTPACVYSGQIAGNHIFELNLLPGDRSYELQTMAPPGQGEVFVPRGYIEITDAATNQTTSYIFEEGFETGNSSAWMALPIIP